MPDPQHPFPTTSVLPGAAEGEGQGWGGAAVPIAWVPTHGGWRRAPKSVGCHVWGCSRALGSTQPHVLWSCGVMLRGAHGLQAGGEVCFPWSGVLVWGEGIVSPVPGPQPPSPSVTQFHCLKGMMETELNKSPAAHGQRWGALPTPGLAAPQGLGTGCPLASEP